MMAGTENQNIGTLRIIRSACSSFATSVSMSGARPPWLRAWLAGVNYFFRRIASLDLLPGMGHCLTAIVT